MKIYVKANSKKEINELLQAGRNINGENFSIFGDGGWYSLRDCETGTIVAVWSKRDPFGNPIPKAWGTWDKEKGLLR